MIASVTTLPWLLTVSLSIHYAAAVAINVIPSIVLCDPAFVAEMPGSGGVVLKIGHFDEVNGVTHVEI
jgi:hypothetical protein